MAIEEATTPAADDGADEWDRERRIVAALDELNMVEQERTGLRLWLQGRLRRAVYERAGYDHYDDATSVSLHEILVDEWKPMELAFGERLQGWQDVFDALPHVEQDYREHAEHKAQHARYTAAQAAQAAAAQKDELAEARVARVREQQQRQQQREEEEYQRWGEVIRQAVDAAGALIVEAMRAAGWEVVGEDPIDTKQEVISDTFIPRFVGRALQFQVPGDSDNWLGELYFHQYSRAKETADHAEREIAKPTDEPTGEPAG